MTWQVQRDGYTAAWIDRLDMPNPFVRVTGPGIGAPFGMEFAIPDGCVMDGCDFMHACITNARASLSGQTVRQAAGMMKGARV